MLSYPAPPGTTPGTNLSGWGGSPQTCGPTGWVLSAAGVFKVINDLANGNVLLTSAQKLSVTAADMVADGGYEIASLAARFIASLAAW